MKKKVPLYLKKHWLTPGEHVLEFVVEGKPEKAGIDPYNKLIDRIPDDNLKTVRGELKLQVRKSESPKDMNVGRKL